jgi:hypothetical protein
MGNTESNIVVNSKNAEKIRADEIDILAEEITRTAKKLWRNYQIDFLNPDFCKNVELSYRNKLHGLTVSQLKNVNDKIENSDSKKFEIYLKYNPNSEEKFIVDELKTELIDLFYNNIIQFEKDKIQLNNYIAQSSAQSSSSMKYIRPGLNKNQKGGQNFENTQNKLKQLLDMNNKTDNKTNNRPKTDKIVNNIPNFIDDSNEIKEVDKLIANMGKKKTVNRDNKQKPRENRQKPRENKQKSPENRDKPRENRDKPRENRDKPRENRDKPRENRDNRQKPRENRDNRQKPRENRDKPRENRDKMSENRDKMSENRDKMSENRDKLLENKESPRKKRESPWENRLKIERDNKKYIREIERVNKASENIIKYKFPTCNENTQKCELTKNELCKAIARNYIVRSNIIAAILSTLPGKDDNGRYVMGFCQNRLKSLEHFKICLPPGFKDLERLSKEERMKELVKYIDTMDESSCRRIGGYYKTLNGTEKEALLTGSNEFNAFYRKFTQQLRTQYTDSLRKLLGILNLLENESTINNKTLNEIGVKTKLIIDNMYTRCQTNYMYAILSYLKADVETTQRTLTEEKEIINSLQEGLL